LNNLVEKPDLSDIETHPPAPRVPWTTKDVWIGLGLFLVWLLVSIGFGLAREIFAWKFDLGLFLVLWEMVLIIPAWWLTIRKYNLEWSALGLRKFDLTTVAIGCGLMVFAFIFNFLYNLALMFKGIQSGIDPSALFGSGASPFLIFLAGIVVAPLVEEVFFRGFIFTGLREKYGWIAGALISATLFAIVHLQPLTMLPIFLMGLIFAYLYQRTESIWPAVIMHFATNTLGLAAAYMISRINLLS
jgi:membrane protease YdiL (CAAX protease family)